MGVNAGRTKRVFVSDIHMGGRGEHQKAGRLSSCSGQPFPDSTLGVSSATAGAIPPLL